MKKFLAVCSFALLGLLASSAQATVVTSLNLNFSSGAVYSGTVTFTDGFGALIDTDGILSGGSYGSQSFGWTWWQGSGQTNPFNYDGDSATYEDILMESNGPGFTSFIGISWFIGNPGDTPVLNLNPTSNYWSSYNGAGQDLIVGGSFGSVPEPGSLALIGIALVGLGVSRYRKQ